MRRAARTDGNHADIVHAFKQMGFSVADTSSAGDGFPDLVVGRDGANFLVEVKDGNKPPSKRRLTPMQISFQDSWRGSFRVVESLDDVLCLSRELRVRSVRIA